MKRISFITKSCIAVILVVVAIILVLLARNYVDTSFATEISLQYYDLDTPVNVIVTDADDINVIKENLRGISFAGGSSCGFSLNMSITFSDGNRSITICPACDSCSLAQIGETDRYIHIKDREALEAVLEKYGMLFPWI